jgi:hypothetical protein
MARLCEEVGLETKPLFHWAHGDGGPSEHEISGKVGYYYVGGERRWIRYDDDDAEFKKLNAALATMMEENVGLPDGDSRTVRDYLASKGVTQAFIDMAESGYANSVNSPIAKLNLRETAQMEKVMEFEDESGFDLHIAGSVGRVIDHLRFGLKVALGWVATGVDYSRKDDVVVTSAHGATIRCRAVVSAVPLPAYKRRVIEFKPALPAPLVATMDKLNFHGAMKCFLLFQKPFWQNDAQGVICAQCPIPEFWFQTRIRRAPEDLDPAFGAIADPAPFMVTAFATNDAARGMSIMTDPVLLRTILGQLDAMYATAANPTPATSSFSSWFKYDWARAEHVWGGYSGPTKGVTMDHRRALQAPIQNRLFLAGEHTSTSFASMHGALDSGTTAASNVSKALPVKPRM